MTAQPQRKSSVRPQVSAAAVSLLVGTLVTACSLPVTPVWQMEGVDACQKAVEKEGFNLEKKIFGALKKCMDKYRQELVDGDPLAPVVDTCEAALGKVLTFPDPEGKSAMAKAKVKLDALAIDPNKCLGDDRLVALGYPPTLEFGDLWARLIMVQSLKQAVDSMVALVGDTVSVFAELQSNGCSTCAQIASSPCTRATCRLAAGSQVEFAVTPGIYAVNADIALDACTNTSILGNDIAIFSSQKQPFQQIAFPTGDAACVRLGSTRGFIAGPASTRSTVAVETCNDHVVNDGNECITLLGGSPTCSTAQPDLKHAGVGVAGACMQLTTSAPSTGESFLFGMVESRGVCTPGICLSDTRGPDAVACTDDDTGPLARYPVPLTTDSADASVLDANNMDGMVLNIGALVTGLPISIDPVDKRFSGQWVTAVPGIHGVNSTPDDEVVQMVLKCD